MNEPKDTDRFDRPSVFVSHSWQDKEAVWPIVELLTAYAAVPWVDSLEMRPGDLLFRRVSSAIEDCAYLLAMVSRSSVASKWVEEEVRQAMSSEFYEGRIRVVPCLLDDVELPSFLRDRLYCDFSRSISDGLVQVLNGIHRTRHVVAIRLDAANPLRLDGETLRKQLRRILTLTSGNQRFFFFLNAINTMTEIREAWRAVPVQGDPFDLFVDDVVRARNALPLVMPNLSCVFSRISDVVIEYFGRDASLAEVVTAVIQRSATICLYRFWTHVRSASEEGVIEALTTINGEAVTSKLAEIDSIDDAHHHPPRNIEAHVHGCTIPALLYLGLRGEDGVFDATLDVPHAALPRDTLEEHLGIDPLSPDSEIPRALWLRYFVPGIAAANVLECAFTGQYIGHFLEKLGLRKEQYEHFGLQ